MNSNTLYETAPEIAVLAGHQFTIPFSAKRVDGGTVDLTLDGTSIKWILATYEEPMCAILTYTNATSAITVGTPPCDFDVHVASADTYDLDGQFRYQVELKSPNDDTFRPIEGLLIVQARNFEEE